MPLHQEEKLFSPFGEDNYFMRPRVNGFQNTKNPGLLPGWLYYQLLCLRD
jgi:hypothetical protein